MILVLKPSSTEKNIDELVNIIESKGMKAVTLKGIERTVIHIHGDNRESLEDNWNTFRCVEKTIKVSKSFKLVSKQEAMEKFQIRIGNEIINEDVVTMIAGPCAIESREQIFEIARSLMKMGIRIMRASAFKPRTSPYAFQGLGFEGLKILREVKNETGILVETEVTNIKHVEAASQYVDIIRIGSRNMHNYDLLKEVGKIDNPIILKRGMAATVKEFIMAAEYILHNGNSNVILCERGIRTFESAYRNTLDLGAVAVLKTETHLPVFVDPSHAAGRRDLVPPLCKAAIAAGADGLLVEVHPDPECALSDGTQSLYPEQFKILLEELGILSNALGKKFLNY